MRSDDAQRPPSGAWLIGVIGALILAATAWIATAEVARTARFAARLEPAAPDRIVHAGVAGALRLAPGALPRAVRAGELLGEIEVAGVLAGIAELRAETDAARARLIRLGAEAAATDGAEPAAPVFPPDLRADAPEVVAAEEALCRARIAEAAQRDRLAEAELAQHRHALEALRARAAAVAEGLAIVGAEMAAQRPLVAAGLAAGRSLEPYRRAEAEQRGETAALASEIARAEAALEAAHARRDSAAEARRAAILSERAGAEGALARLEARRPALVALLAAAEVRSPSPGASRRLSGSRRARRSWRASRSCGSASRGQSCGRGRCSNPGRRWVCAPGCRSGCAFPAPARTATAPDGSSRSRRSPGPSPAMGRRCSRSRSRPTRRSAPRPICSAARRSRSRS